MDDLTYTLRQLCRRNRDGSHNTQADRVRSLALAAHQLHEAGFRQMKASSLKGKHVLALLDRVAKRRPVVRHHQESTFPPSVVGRKNR